MSMDDLLYYAVMNSEEQVDNELALFNERWKHLVNVHNDLRERFVNPVLNEVATRSFKGFAGEVEALQKYIFDNIESVGLEGLSQYAYKLKKLALFAIKLCQEYKIYDDIESVRYNDKTKMIELNGDELYYLSGIEG